MKKTVKFLGLMLSLAMLMGMMPICSVSASQAISLADAADDVKLLGRTTVSKNGIEPHGTGAGIAFYAEGSGDMTLKVTIKPAKFDSIYLAVFVDGELTRVPIKSAVNRKATKTVTIAEGLKDGKHLIEIVRETEEVYGSCVYEELTVNGTISPVENKPLLIEFVGDSMTAGYASYPSTDETKNLSVEHPALEAGVKTYAYVTAQMLDADFQSVCASGYGVVKGWNSDRVMLSDMYDYAGYYHNKKESGKWSFDRPADVVVINLGTNDYEVKAKAADFQEGAKELAQQIKDRNPDAKIVWVTGLMGICFEKELKAVIDELGGAENGFYYTTLPKGMSGGAGHPSIEEHETAAKALVSFLKDNGIVKEAEESAPQNSAAASVTTTTAPAQQDGDNMTLIIIVIAVAAVLLAAIAVVTAIILKKKS